MSRMADRFRRRPVLWVPPAVLFAVALFFLAREWSSARTLGADLEGRLKKAHVEREAAVAEAQRMERLARGAAQSEIETTALYEERFSTEQNRFTDLVREIKRLAEHSGLDPRDIGYPEESLEGFGIHRRSFIFAVEGRYTNLRAFLHLLELSPSFVTVNEISVADRDGGKGLAISLRLTTFFADETGPLPEPVGGGS